MWNIYFWYTLAITFITTSIVISMRSTSKAKAEYYNGVNKEEEEII